MKTAISELDLETVRSLDQALRSLRAEPRTPLAGTTDLYVELNFGTLKPRRFLDIWPLDELRQISLRGDTLVLGALATFTALIESPLVNARLPILVEAARLVGGIQIQNRGTLGGNIANASPAGDSLPVLAAVDAIVVLKSLDTERRVPFTEFYTGYRQTVRMPDELIVAVEVPPVEGTRDDRPIVRVDRHPSESSTDVFLRDAATMSERLVEVPVRLVAGEGEPRYPGDDDPVLRVDGQPRRVDLPVLREACDHLTVLAERGIQTALLAETRERPSGAGLLLVLAHNHKLVLGVDREPLDSPQVVQVRHQLAVVPE